jgi:hypothetical protein
LCGEVLKLAKSNRIAFLLLSMFGLVFVAGGVLFLYAATHQHPARHHAQQPLWPFAIGAGVFFLVGFGVLIMAIVGGRTMKQESELKADHPDQPWMWKIEWATRNIPDHVVASAVGGWIIALVVTGIAIPAAIGGLQGYLHKHNNLGLIGLIFPLIAIGLIFVATRNTLRIMKYGKSNLRLKTLPAPIGGVLAGTICVQRPIDSADGIKLRLVCIHRVQTGGGKNQHVTETVRWEDEQILNRLPPCNSGAEIPVSFRIPPGAASYDDSNMHNQIIWRLECRAHSPGVSYYTRFNVPVFAAGSVPDEQNIPDPAAPFRESKAMLHPGDPGISILPLAGGGQIFHFAPLRNKVFAANMTFMSALFLAIGICAIYFMSSLFFSVIFTGIGALLFIGAVRACLASTTVTIRHGSLTVENSLPTLSPARHWNAQDIQEIFPKISVQSGNTAYYKLCIKTASPNPTSIPATIASKTDADWPAQEMTQSLHH